MALPGDCQSRPLFERVQHQRAMIAAPVVLGPCSLQLTTAHASGSASQSRGCKLFCFPRNCWGDDLWLWWTPPPWLYSALRDCLLICMGKCFDFSWARKKGTPRSRTRVLNAACQGRSKAGPLRRIQNFLHSSSSSSRFSVLASSFQFSLLSAADNAAYTQPTPHKALQTNPTECVFGHPLKPC